MKKYNLDPWEKSAADRRDRRSIKSSDETENLPAKKDTKRWCKGKEGIEHQLKIFDGKSVKSKTLNCELCGKCIAIYWTSFSWDRKNPPFWIEYELLAKCVIEVMIRLFDLPFEASQQRSCQKYLTGTS